MSAMKRDQSLIFTAVPEEDSDHSVTTTDTPFIPATKKIRPKFLNLKSISIDLTPEIKSVKAPTTPFCGQTSVCSTPMTELKRFVHQNPLSICKNGDIKDEVIEDDFKTEKDAEDKENHLENKKFDLELVLNKIIPYMDISLSLSETKKYSSFNDVSISKETSQYWSLRYELEKNSKRRFKTITDPTFPVFKPDGTNISRPFYDDYLEMNLSNVTNEPISENHFLGFDTTKPKPATENNNKETSKTDLPNSLPTVPRNNREHRKSLTLPLKSFGTDSVQTPGELLTKRHSTGVQLTPLMSKLSMLAFEERSSGFCSRETTPCEYRGVTPTQSNYSFPYKYKNSKEMKARCEDDYSLQKCLLFVCGQQDVVLTMLLREECKEEATTVRQLVSLIFIENFKINQVQDTFLLLKAETFISH